jgi:toxin-antitoxin system PIN domain toxin
VSPPHRPRALCLLDVNALVALAWDSHIHHVAVRKWFDAHGRRAWATCAATESGFVRVSSNPKILPSPIAVRMACEVLRGLRALPGHTFLTDDVSLTDSDFPVPHGYRQVTDAHLLTLSGRHGAKLLTFDAGIGALAQGDRNVEVLSAL